jgi:hypothetical protein
MRAPLQRRLAGRISRGNPRIGKMFPLMIVKEFEKPLAALLQKRKHHHLDHGLYPQNRSSARRQDYKSVIPGIGGETI